MLALAAVTLTGASHVVVFGVLVAAWSVFAWALNPPMQASVLAAVPQGGMIALALNISALYLGTGIAGALGGVIAGFGGVSYIPLAAAALLATALLVASARIPAPSLEPLPAMAATCDT